MNRIIALGCLSFISAQVLAQDINKEFKSYNQTIPGSSVSFNMVPISAGNFTMGSPSGETGRDTDEGPQRTVSISPFWMAALEVSRDAFDIFYKDEEISQNSSVDAITRPSPQYVDMSWGMGKEGGYPVNSMSQHTALMYCRWLYEKTGIFYRLPTEAEWEYACRAGSTTTYFFGNESSEMDKYAWFKGNSENKFHKSGTKLPNAWGLYDMMGNVSEWTMDHYSENNLQQLKNNTKDPKTAHNASRYPKVVKGGSFLDDAKDLRSANRIKSDISWNRRDPQVPKSKWWLTDAKEVGFRVVRPFVQPSPEEVNAFFKEYLGN